MMMLRLQAAAALFATTFGVSADEAAVRRMMQDKLRGSGRRKIAILSDPNCMYCKRLEEDLAKLDDVTVHILPYAILSPASVRQAKAVWCSKDLAKAWDDLMFRRIEPRPERDCETPVEQLQDYGRRIGARATPTWFLQSGERYSGALPLEEVRRLLDEASPLKR